MYLRDSKRITLESCTHGTLVTILNWEVYQGDSISSGTPAEHGEDTGCIRTENELHYSEEGKKEEDYSPTVERKRSPVGAIEVFQGKEPLEEILKDVTQSVQRAWLAAYPDAEWVKREILKALVWIEANPRKKSKSFARFMGNWLSKGWESHRKSLPSGSKINTTPIRLDEMEAS